MISYQIYKIIHILGIAVAFYAFGRLAISIQSKASDPKSRKVNMMLHGVGLFLILLGGFGMMARLGIINGIPGWIWAKLSIWLILGGIVVLFKKLSHLMTVWMTAIFALLIVAVYLAQYKPF